jgi:hypothetical protein
MNDGCNTIIQCGTCSGLDICGGSGRPSVCGSILPDAGQACTNLCLNQAACTGTDGGTTFTGTVVAPTQADAGYGNPDPIPGALVYVPNATVLPFSDGGVTCDQCTDGVSGSPLVSTTTATNGTFTLNNVPCGVPVPLVIQLGKWRRQITVPAQTCCSTTALTQEQTRLPRKQGEQHANDNIPLIAVVTGDVDTIECVLPKIGIAGDQYSLPSGNGRVRLYRDNGQKFTTGTTPAASTLFDSLAEMKKYDMIILDCVGFESTKSLTQRANMEAYTNAGGRIFASHFAYVWLYGWALDPNNNAVASTISFTNTATWNVGQGSPADQDAYIDTTFTKGATFAQWVRNVNAQAASSTATSTRIRVNTVRHDLDAVTAPAQRWVYAATPAGIPLQYTFNTPTTATNQCGRVLFSDFHVINASGGSTATWPAKCSVGAMTPQEKVFEYLIFDLSSCIKPDVPPPQHCTPRTCGSLNCGDVADGCGSTINCGMCTSPASCGGGGTPNVCGVACVPKTCAQLGANCGNQGDGCGNQINCGTCMGANQTCGGGGTPNVCGGGSCVPKTCAQLGANCGQQNDGCGNIIASCGPCVAPQTCGGGGVAGQCGGGSCTPLSCAAQGFNCGQQGDGCGGSQGCGMCTPPQVCGGGGQPGVCGGGGTCTPRTCTQQGFNCGSQGDGCGNQINCGTCPMGQVCGAQGPGQCGAVTCTPLTCTAQNIHCGPAGDGCGNIIQCGACPTGQTCGGAGVPGQCGVPPCTPRTCSQVGANCGSLGDGCGGTLSCGVCPPSQSCGGGGIPNVCGGIG